MLIIMNIGSPRYPGIPGKQLVLYSLEFQHFSNFVLVIEEKTHFMLAQVSQMPI